MNKKIIIAIAVVIIAGFSLYQLVFKNNKEDFDLAEVSLGRVVQEVSETGRVQKGEEIKLGFKTAGRIDQISAKVGQEVWPGQSLARLDTAQLLIQLEEVKSNLAFDQADLDKLLAGASQEEIKTAQTKVSNKEIALSQAEQGLGAAYQDGLNVLKSAYLKVYNAQVGVDSVQRSYFTKTDQEGIRVRENQSKLAGAAADLKSSLETAEADSSHININESLYSFKNKLSDIAAYLKIIRETCETVDYRNIVSSTDKTSLDTYRSNINTVLTDVVDSQQDIAAASLDVDSAKGQLQQAKDDLALLTAPARQEDIDLKKSKLAKSQAQVNLLERQLQEAVLASPTRGQIIEVKKKTGEVAGSQETVLVLLPADPFEIKVDIYEEDAVKVKTGNPVAISLVAFSQQVFSGKVIGVNPSAKLIDEVVYYQATIDFDKMPEGLKPGMTADITIQTALKENVLTMPESALMVKAGKNTVWVYKEGQKEEREVEIGLMGSNNLVEIVSGLSAGEKVILP